METEQSLLWMVHLENLALSHLPIYQTPQIRIKIIYKVRVLTFNTSTSEVTATQTIRVKVVAKKNSALIPTHKLFTFLERKCIFFSASLCYTSNYENNTNRLTQSHHTM